MNRISMAILLVSLIAMSRQEDEKMVEKNIGSPFPRLKAETLSGIKVIYPDDVQGKVTLLLLAFKRETQQKIDSWLEAFLDEFSADTSVQFFEIPMLAKRWKLLAPIIDGGMRSGIPREKHGSVTTFYGDINSYRELLSMKDTSDCFVFLLDKEGTIQWRSHGAADGEKLRGLFEKIRYLQSK